MPLGWSGPDLVCRGVNLILDGALDEGTEAELGRRLGVSARHLRRLFLTHLGATPDQLARSRRAHFARRLLDDTDLTITDIAFASGYGSVRQLNRACHEIFRASPRDLRARRRVSDRLVADGGLVLRLPFTGRFDWAAMVTYFARRAIPGVESVDGGVYRRSVVIEGNPGVLEVEPGGPDHLLLRAHLPEWRGLIHVVERARRIFSLDAPPDAAVDDLSDDPVVGDLVRRRPGLRVPGAWDPFEIGVRAIVGQQISVAGATTLLGRVAERLGPVVPGVHQLGLTRTFPTAETLADADLTGIGLMTARAATVRSFATAVSSGAVALDGSVATDELVDSLVAVPGIGPWTAQYVALRLGERDAFPAGDAGLRAAISSRVAGRTETEVADGWRPWRALAAVHLWFAGSATSVAA